MATMGSLGLLVEACIKREDEDEDESFSEEDEQHEEESMIDEHSSYTCAPCNPSSIAPIACFSSNQISKNLNYKILYCKARGMSLDHIGSNAILQFESGSHGVHGAELRCSHQLCKDDGIKFRYCKHCSKAVAKRNFRKRHAHPELIDVENLPASIITIPLPAHHPPQPQMYMNNTRPIPSISSSMSMQSTPLLKNTRGDESSKVSDTESVLQPMDIDTRVAAGETSQLLFGDTKSNTSCCQDIPSAWIELYRNRPNRGNIYSKQEWLQQVMKVAQVGVNTDETSRNHCDEDESSKQITPSNSVLAVQEEFSNNFPPRFVTYDEGNIIKLEEGKPKYRQHAESLSLQISTDLDLLGTHSIMLDSNGSIIISCTPKT